MILRGYGYAENDTLVMHQCRLFLLPARGLKAVLMPEDFFIISLRAADYADFGDGMMRRLHLTRTACRHASARRTGAVAISNMRRRRARITPRLNLFV